MLALYAARLHPVALKDSLAAFTQLGSLLLKQRIIFLTGAVYDQVSSLICAQLLYLESDNPSKEISFYRPMLPPFVDELHLHNLRLSSGAADVHLQRHGGEIAVTQTRREGDVNVIVRH